MNIERKQDVELLLAAGLSLLIMTCPVLAAEPSTDFQSRATMEETTISESVIGAPRVHALAGNRRAVRVNFSDLNLDSSAGLESLYQRLANATQAVCAPREESRNLARYRDWQRCRTSAMDSAIDKIGSLDLQNLHAARSERGEDVSSRIANR